jgi:hypothetical protein
MIFAVNRTSGNTSWNLHRCGILRGKMHRMRNAEIRSSGNGPEAAKVNCWDHEISIIVTSLLKYVLDRINKRMM